MPTRHKILVLSSSLITSYRKNTSLKNIAKPYYSRTRDCYILKITPNK